MATRRTDPVLHDQGGRSVPIDPLHPVSPTREQFVRVRAYEIYEQNGREDGRDIDHWLAAEEELTTGLEVTAGTREVT